MNPEDKKIILIIGKERYLSNFLKNKLVKYFQIVEAKNDETGLSLARQISPDIVLCDISTPSIGGLEICKILKSDSATSHISVILLESNEVLVGETEILLAGADDYILRTFDKTLLKIKIDNLIRSREGLRSHFMRERHFPLELGGLDNKFVEKLEHLVAVNLGDPNFGVHQIALEMGVSVSVLYRKIRQQAGITVNDYVKTIRMKKALHLLEAGIYKVNEVAADVGFEDSKYFSREFRKTFGKTPIQIKRRRV